jgi:LDH2 family malate/lactate/ureidoglycolate dehydrogenase
MSTVDRLEHGKLLAFATEVLERIGMPADHAGTTADCLIMANLRGLDSHGVLRLPQYAKSVRQGGVEPAPEIEVTDQGTLSALVDAGGGYGYVPTLLAADLAVSKAGKHGMAVVAVRNSHHFGMAAIYAERIARDGLIGIALTNTGPVLPPPGGRRPLAGNNPMAIAVPRRDSQRPVVLDMAMSQTAFGRIRLAAAEGRPIPTGWAMNADGEPTTDAAEALRVGLLAPTGAHKGFALAIMIDLLAGVLTGSPFGVHADAHDLRAGGVGHLVIALSPTLFRPQEDFDRDVETMIAQLRTGDPEGVVVLPGEPEHNSEVERRRDGVPISAELAGHLIELAREVGVPHPF